MSSLIFSQISLFITHFVKLYSYSTIYAATPIKKRAPDFSEALQFLQIKIILSFFCTLSPVFT